MDLKEKVGPLPAWGWIAGVGGVGLLFILYHRKHATTTNTASGTASVSPAYASTVPVGVGSAGGSGGYYYDGGGYPVQATNGASGANSGTPSHPYMLISDIGDLKMALSAGIPSSWLAYAGTDPFANKANQDPDYAAPNGLPSLSSIPAGSQIAYGGLANQIAPNNATKVYGATRTGTANAFQQWYQGWQQYGQNIGYYVPQ